MPWCFECDRYLAPNAVNTDGTCPSCGRPIDPVEPTISASTAGALAEEGGAATHLVDADDVPGEVEDVKAPWHFWVMIAAASVYMGWRLLQGVGWAIQHWL